MLGLFLQEAAFSNAELAALMTAMAGFMAIFSMIGIAIFIYSAFAFMTIAKKLKTEPAWLAFIPIANLYLISKMAKMHWWPILLLIGFFIPYVNLAVMIAFSVFALIWLWKVFERVGRPGWWPLLSLIPVIGPVIFLVLLGIAAWSK